MSGQTLFRPAGRKQAWDSHRVLYGHILCHDTGEVLDEALLLFMQAPRSFTAEDVTRPVRQQDKQMKWLSFVV